MARPTYATAADYAARPGTSAPPDDIDQRLTDASRRLDRMLLTAVYAVGDDGAPSNADLAGAFAVATCELVRYELDAGADGDDGRWTSVTAGPVSMARAGPDEVLAGLGLPPKAVDALSGFDACTFRVGAVRTW